MAYREVDMWEILGALRRIGRGESISAVHRATGRDRKTIRRYVELAEELDWVREQEEPSEDLAGAVWRRIRPVPEEEQLGRWSGFCGPTRTRSSSGSSPGRARNEGCV